MAAIGAGDAFSKGRGWEAINDVITNFTRRVLREDETTMKDRSSRRVRTLVTQMARSRPDR